MVGSCSETGNAPDYVSVGDLTVSESPVRGCLVIQDTAVRVNHSCLEIKGVSHLEPVSRGSACHIQLLMLGENLFRVGMCVSVGDLRVMSV